MTPTKTELRRLWKSEYPKDPELRARAGRSLCRWLRGAPGFAEAVHVGLFASFPWELDVTPLWDPGRGCFPRVEGPGKMAFYRVRSLADLKPGYGGIPEPPPDDPVVFGPEDILLVPGFAFDPRGGRVGTGAGFYDRFLAGCPAAPWGVGWEAQIRPSVPRDPFDVPMRALATETGWRAVEK